MDLSQEFHPCPKPSPRQKKSKAPLSRTTSLDRGGQPLQRVGKRGKRLAKEDKKAADECHKLPCVCGCSLPTQWCHLDGRSEDVRHDPVYSVPGCEYLHPGWLDQGDGVTCKKEMRDRATIKGDRLEHDDVYDLLVKYGYYTWLNGELERRRI